MEWFYAQANSNERQGPRSLERMREKVRAGELGPNDRVWRVGFAQWMAVASVPELASALPGAAAQLTPVAARASKIAQPASGTPIAAAVPTAVAAHDLTYYAPRSDTPERVQRNLKGFAPATGPTGDWPLDDAHVEQLGQASKLRKRILSAANLARLFFALTLIALVIFAVTALVAATSNARSTTQQLIPMTIAAGSLVPFVLLYAFAARAIRHCRTWGSLVMAIVSTLGILLQLGSLGMAIVSINGRVGVGPDVVPLILGTVVASLIGLAIAVVFWRAVGATSKFLATPVWCQEATVVAERAK